MIAVKQINIEEEVSKSVEDFNESKKEINEAKKEIRAAREIVDAEMKTLSIQDAKVKKDFIDQIKLENANDVKHGLVIFNTFNKPFEHCLNHFSGEVKYSFEYTDEKKKLEADYKAEMVDRAFNLDFKLASADGESFVVKIKNQWFNKTDILKIYNAFRLVITDKVDSLLINNRKNNEKKETKLQAQMQIFADDFNEPFLRDIPITVFINSDYHVELVELKFDITKVRDQYGLKISKGEYLSCQDLYFIYTHYERIINLFLNR